MVICECIRELGGEVLSVFDTYAFFCQLFWLGIQQNEFSAKTISKIDQMSVALMDHTAMIVFYRAF